MNIRCHANVRVLLAATAAFLATSLSAQVLEEIVVTAQKREQNIQDVGIAITALRYLILTVVPGKLHKLRSLYRCLRR